MLLSRARRGLLLGVGMCCLGVRAHDALDAATAALVGNGEAALARGDASAALAAFEAAAERAHAPQIELAIVRARMLQGDYRRALAFAAHVAGAHADAPEGAVQYAWLLHLGAQGAAAGRVIAQAQARVGAHPLFASLRQAIARGATTTPDLLAAPLRLAPPESSTLPRGLQVAASATRLPDGARALSPDLGLDAGARVWTRDGLGRAEPAHVLGRVGLCGLVLLQLEGHAPANGSAVARWALRDPFPGAPAFVASHRAQQPAQPAWPVMRAGFIGALGAQGEFTLSDELAPGPGGGPVFDAAGRCVGVAVPDAAGRPMRVGIAALDKAGVLPLQDMAPEPAPRAPVDAIYATALATTLQILLPES